MLFACLNNMTYILAKGNSKNDQPGKRIGGIGSLHDHSERPNTTAVMSHDRNDPRSNPG